MKSRVRASFVVITALALVVGLAAPGAWAWARAGRAKLPAQVVRGPFGPTRDVRAPVRSGFAISRTDGNDVKGPLDLRSMKVTRGKSADTVAFTTYDPVSTTSLDPKNGNFAFLVDTNDDRKYEYAVYVFWAAGKIRGALYDLHAQRTIDRSVPTSRKGLTGFKTQFNRAKISSTGTYRFALFGYYQGTPCSKKKPCVDAIPNRYPLIPLDYTAPTVKWGTTYQYSTDARSDLNSPVSFTSKDDKYGTGLSSWTLYRKAKGSSKWMEVRSGRTAPPAVLVPGKEGTYYDVRLVAIDKQQNKTTSPIKTIGFPFDDGNPSITYDVNATPTATSGAFLDSVTSLAQTSVATIDFTGGSKICLLLGPTTGAPSVDVLVDGGPTVNVASEGPSTPVRDRSTCFLLSGSGAHEVTLTVTTTDAFVLDGYLIKP